MKGIPEAFERMAETFRARSLVYGDNYLRFGDVMVALFPDGLELRTEDDWNRFGVLVQCIHKLTRYAAALPARGGHADSAHDLAVYAAMLESLTPDGRGG